MSCVQLATSDLCIQEELRVLRSEQRRKKIKTEVECEAKTEPLFKYGGVIDLT